MENICDFCGKEFTKADGGNGSGNKDSLMVNDYLTMTEWYRNNKPDWFKMSHPNSYGCRGCIQLLMDAGLFAFIGGNPSKFLTT